MVSYSYQTNTFDLASVSCLPGGQTGGSYTTEYFWAAGRMTNVHAVAAGVDGGNFSYSYLPNSNLLQQTDYLNGTVIVHRAWDALDRLTNILARSSLGGGGCATINSFSYTRNFLGRRTQRQDVDGSQTSWGYDSYDQLTSASRANGPNGAFDAAYDYQYIYDQAGNRIHEDRGQLDLNGTFNNLGELSERVGEIGNSAATLAVQRLEHRSRRDKNIRRAMQSITRECKLCGPWGTHLHMSQIMGVDKRIAVWHRWSELEG